MRHPFWQWTGWLCFGLTGCLHGQDWRAAVTSPKIQSVADRRESRPQPKVVGPFRSGQSKFAPPPEVANPPVIAGRPPSVRATNGVPQFSQEVTRPLTTKPEARSRSTQVIPVGLEVLPSAQAVPQVVVPPAGAGVLQATRQPATAPSTAIVELSRSETFAEFERAIPLGRSISASTPALLEMPYEVIVVEESEPEKATAMPVISPADAFVSAKSMTTQKSQVRSLKPKAAASDDRSRGLFSKSAVLAKELPEVTETTSAEENSFNPDDEPSVRPQDVSILVEQVFEDLRLRRLNDARQRTEWLKQLVMKRVPASAANVVREGASVETNDNRFREPRRVEVDPRAAAVERVVPDSFVTDEESTSSK